MIEIYRNSLPHSLHAHTMVSSPAFRGLETDNAVDPPTTNVHKFTTTYSWSLQQPHVVVSWFHQIVSWFQSERTSLSKKRYLYCRQPPTLQTHCWFEGLHKAPSFDLCCRPSCSNFWMPVRPGAIDRAKPNAASNPLKRKPSRTRSRRKKTFTPKMPIFHLQTADFRNSSKNSSGSNRCTPNAQNPNSATHYSHRKTRHPSTTRPEPHRTLHPPTAFIHSFISGKQGRKREEIEV